MSFDLIRRVGTVVVNLTVVNPKDLRDCLGDITQVFDKGYAMGTQVGLFGPGESIGETTVPPARWGFARSVR